MRKFWYSTRKLSILNVMSVTKSSPPPVVWSSMSFKFIRRTLPRGPTWLNGKLAYREVWVRNSLPTQVPYMVAFGVRLHRVPNAKPEREATDIEIYGMQGIPSDVLAAHYGELDEETPSKSAKVDAAANLATGAMPAGVGFPSQPPYGGMRPPMYNPAVPGPLGWQPRPPAWCPPPPAVSLPAAGVPQAPIFPVHSGPPQPAFQIPGPHSAQAPVPVSQPLFPVGAPTSVPNQNASGAQFAFPGSVSTNGLGDVRSSAPYANATHMVNNYNVPPVQVGVAGNSRSYSSGPNTGGPSIGPPPVIANKAPAPQPASNEVYLVWDDDPMSIEERRMSLQKYQVHDETSQMNSVDAAIDRRISQSRLAGRMAF